MLSDITLGQYVPGSSFIHRLDARVKIILVFIYTFMLFTVNTITGYLIYIIFTVAAIAVSRVPFRFIVRGLRPMMFILIFTAVVNLFMTDGETVVTIFQYGSVFIRITDRGIELALQMIARLLLLLTGTSLLTLTTPPIMLTDAVEYIISPLKKIGVPSHEIAMMITIAMRFIPTLAEEADRIMKAQTARGADFESGGLIRRARAMLTVMIPLFLSALRRADELACAMDSRCYNGGAGRTRMKVMKTTERDIAAACVCGVFFLSVIAVEIIGVIKCKY